MKLNDIKSPNGEFYKLQDGNNEMRIVSDPEERPVHYEDGTNKAFDCVGKANGCPGCEKGERPTLRYMFYIIDRRDGHVKQAQFPWTIVKQYKALAMTKDYAFSDLPDYDLTIKKEGQGLLTKYTLIPGRAATPITDAERAEIAAQPPLVEVIAEMKSRSMASVNGTDKTNIDDIAF